MSSNTSYGIGSGSAESDYGRASEIYIYPEKWLRFLMKVPEGRRDMQWAREMDESTIMLHEAVWSGMATCKYVGEVIVPLMEKAVFGLQDLSVNHAGKTLIGDYIADIEDRIRNANRYADGKPSQYMTEERVEELAAVASGRGR